MSIGAWAYGLEGAGEDGNFGVFNALVHLGVAEVLVEGDTFDEHSILELASGFAFDFDEVKVDITPF